MSTFNERQNPEMTILQEAHELVFGDRQDQYGDPHKNLTAIANQWEMYLANKFSIDLSLDAEDICWMMIMMKMCRDFRGHKRDTIVDVAGYAQLIERVRKTTLQGV